METGSPTSSRRLHGSLSYRSKASRFPCSPHPAWEISLERALFCSYGNSTCKLRSPQRRLGPGSAAADRHPSPRPPSRWRHGPSTIFSLPGWEGALAASPQVFKPEVLLNKVGICLGTNDPTLSVCLCASLLGIFQVLVTGRESAHLCPGGGSSGLASLWLGIEEDTATFCSSEKPPRGFGVSLSLRGHLFW